MPELYKEIQYKRFCAYGFFKNLRFFDPFLILYLLSTGSTYTEIGIFYAIREITIHVFEIPSGILADLLGRKRILMIAFVLYILSFVLFYTQSFIGFTFAFFAFGLGDATRSGIHKAMIVSYLHRHGWEKEKVQYYGRTRSWSQRGSAISALISAFIVFLSGRYDLVFMASILPYIIDIFIIGSYPSWLNGEQTYTKGSFKTAYKQHFQDLKSQFFKLQSVAIISNTALYIGYYKALKDYIQPILAAFAGGLILLPDVSMEKNEALIIGSFYTLLYFLSAFASQNAGSVQQLFKTDARGLNGLLFIGISLGGVAGWMHWQEHQLPAILAFSCIVIVQNFRRPLGMSYIGNQFKKELLASVYSIESQTEALFSALIAVGLGLMADLWGLGIAIVILSVGLLLIASLIRLK
jgi:MFS family permease